MTYDPTWIRKSPILIPQAIRNDSLTAQKGSVRLDALDWGQKVAETTVDTTLASGNKLLSVTPLNNGKMFVAWGTSTNGRYNIVDSEGTADSTAYQSFEAANFLYHDYGLATVLLPNGNVVVAYGQDSTANALVLKIFDENGDLVRDTVTVKTNATETQWSVGLAALPDGNFVVTWNEAAVGNQTYFAIYDLDGDIVRGYTSLGGNYGRPTPAPLSDGNWIVTYESGGNINFRTYDRMGIGIKGDTLFRSSATQAPGLTTLGNGQVVVPFQRGFGIIDRHGNVVVAPTTKEVAGSYSITVLPHDHIVGQQNNGNDGSYTIYDTSGNIVKTKVSYVTDADQILAASLGTFKNGNFILAYASGPTQRHVKFLVHQGTQAGFGGNLAIDGALSLQTGTSVNEISIDGDMTSDSDNILSTQKAIKYYVDNTIGSQATNRIYQQDSEVRVIDTTAESYINVIVDGSQAAQFLPSGFALSSGSHYVNTISNDTAMGGYDGALGSEDALTTQYAARKYVDDIHLAESEPTGFPFGNNNAYTTVGTDSSNVIYIEPTSTSYDIFLSGQRWVKDSRESVVITDVEGMHYVYFDLDGVLKQTTTFSADLIYTRVYVAAVYWDATNKEILYVGDERHGITMDGKTHANIHFARGTLYIIGLGLDNVTADSTSAIDTDAQFGLENGRIFDEDIGHNILDATAPANIPMWYLDGSANWRKQAADDFPLTNTGTGRVAWNKEDGTWSLVEANDGNYVLTHIFATNDPSQHFIGIVGQAEYTTLSAARLGATSEINSLITVDLPFVEFVPVATVIYQTSDSFANTPKAIIVSNDEGASWTDWRTSGLSPAAGSANDHSSLTGLGFDDHIQYTHVDGRRDFTGHMTFQAGIDVSGGTLELPLGTSINEFSIDGTLVGDSDDAVPTEQAVKTYVDTAIANLNPDKIWEGDSYVEVVDDGTATGYVEIVTDSIQVAYFDADATTQRIGKASGAGRLVVADASITATVNTEEVLTLQEEEQRIGPSTGARLEINNTDSTAAPFATLYGSDDSYINVANEIGIAPSGYAEALRVTDEGIKLEYGTVVNEFSTDGTLADDSTSAIPTEYAVKTYVDAQIGGQSNIIFEDNSKVEVHDDGVNPGYVEIVADGVQVAYFDAQATSQRIGKASGAGRVVVADASITNFIAATDVFSLTANVQRLGVSGDTYLQATQSTDTIIGLVNNVNVLDLSTTGYRLGESGDTYFSLGTALSGSATLRLGNITYLQASSSGQMMQVGLTANNMYINTATNTLTLTAGSANVLNATATSQTFGVAGDSRIVLDQTADTFLIAAGANTKISGGLNTMTLGVSGDTTILLEQVENRITITAGGESQIMVETSGTTVYDDLTVTGDLFVDGTTFVVSTTEVKTADNIITVNYGEPGAGVTAGYAGIEVDRGSLTNYWFTFHENTDTFRIGEEGDTQAVATREDSPGDLRLVWWNNTEKRLDTLGDTYVTLDTTGAEIIFVSDSVTRATITNAGLTLQSGTAINEFSIDGTLSGDSDNAVPTEKAIKAYVDAQIGGVSNWIFQDDSFVRVVDDGTASGYIEIVADGVQVAYFDAESTTQRIGKAAESRMLVSDETIVFHAGLTPSIQLTLDEDGLSLASGISVNAISDSTSMGASSTTLLTESAAKIYIDNRDAATLSSAQGYANGVAATAESNAKSYADGVGSAAVASANGYTNGEISTLDSTLRGVIAAGDATTLVDANAYTDDEIGKIELDLKTYIDAGDATTLVDANAYTDGEISTLDSTLRGVIAAGDATTLVDANAYTDGEISTLDSTLSANIAAGDATTLVDANGYTDDEINKLKSELDLINVKVVYADTTAVTGDVLLVDTTSGDVDIEMIAGEDTRIIIKKKTTDGNKINISTPSGMIDGQNLVIIDTPYQSFTFVSDGTSFYII